MDKGLNLSVFILGNSAAIPTKTGHLSSQLLTYKNNGYLIDCGEGTQMQLIKYNIKHGIIDYIFISHLHGDHFFGLIGLLSTYHLLGRNKPLNIFAPAPLKNIINIQLDVVHTKLSFDVVFHELKGKSLTKILDTDDISVYSFPLVHRIDTWGFKFVQRSKQRKIKKSFIKKYNPRISDIQSIINGDDYTTDSGNVIANSKITIPPPKPQSYAYCSDTRFDDSIAEYVKNTTLLYHEATFDNSMQQRAFEKFHSTSGDAARIAKKANVSKLIIGHFSARINDYEKLREEAAKIFPDTIISEEGKEYIISS